MSGVNTSSDLLKDAVNLCSRARHTLSATQSSMQRDYRRAGNDWSDEKYRQLGDIVNECDFTIKKSVNELNICLTSLERLRSIVTEYENVSLGSRNSSAANDISSGIIATHFGENSTLRPNTEYTSGEFGYRYKTDSQGRIISFRADNLQMTAREKRLPHDSNTLDKLEFDHAGHLIGDRFGGSPRLDNLVSQHSRLNSSDYKTLENLWERAIRNGHHVEISADVIYETNSGRPSSFEIYYAIDGDVEVYNMLN
jgi:hypothetical protein